MPAIHSIPRARPARSRELHPEGPMGIVRSAAFFVECSWSVPVEYLDSSVLFLERFQVNDKIRDSDRSRLDRAGIETKAYVRNTLSHFGKTRRVGYIGPRDSIPLHSDGLGGVVGELKGHPDARTVRIIVAAGHSGHFGAYERRPSVASTASATCDERPGEHVRSYGPPARLRLHTVGSPVAGGASFASTADGCAAGLSAAYELSSERSSSEYCSGIHALAFPGRDV